jgi:hypothetical protein
LLLTLKNPFVPRESRKIYYKISLAIIMIFVTFINKYSHNFDKRADAGKNWFFDFMVCLPVMLSIWIWKLISRKGSSKELKKRVLLRHYIYLVLYMIWQIRDFGYQSNFGVTCVYIFSDLCGICLGFVRCILEPYVFYILTKELNKLFSCCKSKNKKAKI